jgi:hypothetical protein
LRSPRECGEDEDGESFAPTTFPGLLDRDEAEDCKQELRHHREAIANILFNTEISPARDYLRVELSLPRKAIEKKKAVLMLNRLESPVPFDGGQTSGGSDALSESATLRGLKLLGSNMKRLLRGEEPNAGAQPDSLAPGDHCRSSGDVAEDEFSPALFPHLRN